MAFSVLILSATPPPATSAPEGGVIVGAIGAVTVLVIFGFMVWRTLRRNRLRK